MPFSDLVPAEAAPLSATQQRVFSSLVFLLDDKLAAMRAGLLEPPAGVAHHWQADLPAAQRQVIEADMEYFTAELAGLHAAYQLATQARSPRRELAYRAAQLWEILGDATAAKFRGYGPPPPALAADWNARIARLTGPGQSPPHAYSLNFFTPSPPFNQQLL